MYPTIPDRDTMMPKFEKNSQAVHTSKLKRPSAFKTAKKISISIESTSSIDNAILGKRTDGNPDTITVGSLTCVAIICPATFESL